MLPFGVTIPATVPQGSEIPEGLTNNPVYPEETEINLVKFHLTDVFISWFHFQSDYFLTALSGGLIAFRSELLLCVCVCVCDVYLNLAEILSLSLHISYTECA